MPKNRLLILFALLNFSHIVDFMIMMPLGPSFMRIFAVTPTQFGWLVSTYAISAGTMGLLAALYVDRFDRKRSLIFFYAGFVVGTFMCTITEGYWSLLLARGLTGAFGGVIISVIMSIVSDLVPYEKRAQAVGIVSTGFALASILGVPLGLLLANSFNWHTPFLALGLLGIILLIAVTKMVPSVRGHVQKVTASPLSVLSQNLTDPDRVKALLFTGCLNLGQFTVIPFISPSLVRNVGFSESQLPYVYFFGGIFSIVASPLAGRLADRYGKLQVFVIGALLSVAPILIITQSGPTSLVFILFVTSTFFVTMSGRMVPGMAMVSASAGPAGRGSFMGFVSATQQICAAVSASVAGLIISEGPSGTLLQYDRVGFIAVVFTFLAIFLAFKLSNKEGAEK